MKIAAIVLAAGNSNRFGGGIPKQYRTLGARSVLAQSLCAFIDHPDVSAVVPVINAEHRTLFAEAIQGLDESKITPPAAGGPTRQVSVRAGLRLAEKLGVDIVLIHDAARPFVTSRLIDRAIAAAAQFGAAIPEIPVSDTIVTVDKMRVASVPPRSQLRAVQTPQAFRTDLIVSFHDRAAAAGRDDFTDDGSLVMAYGGRVHLFLGETSNMKLTEASDLEIAAQRLAVETMPIIRVGTGFDVHGFCDGDHVWLGGVRIPHSRALAGHSDADVALHALTDALLGTMGDGDIGAHFPPSDPKWKGAPSNIFLEYAAGKLRDRRAAINHMDTTIICEAPAIAPWREAMRARIAGICGIQLDCVSVKATTSEKLGFTGRREGIAAMATATVRFERRAQRG